MRCTPGSLALSGTRAFIFEIKKFVYFITTNMPMQKIRPMAATVFFFDLHSAFSFFLSALSSIVFNITSYLSAIFEIQREQI